MSRHRRPPPSQIKVVTRECSDAAGVQVHEGRCRIATRKSGATDEQICGQAFDAGNVRGALLTAAHAAGGDNPAPPAPPASDSSKEKKKNDNSSSIDDPRFIEGYRAAYATIYERNDYASAIGQLKALGQDDRADVANLIGCSYRKLGDYKVSQIWD